MPRARTLLVALIAVLMLAAPAGADGPRDRALRVITFNIHHGADGAEQLDLERIARVIEHSGAAARSTAPAARVPATAGPRRSR